MGDVLVTEYIEHPQEATGVIPLFPTQSIVPEMRYTNTTLTDLDLNIIPGEDSVYGTTVGIAVFTKMSSEVGWELRRYETRSTADVNQGAIQVHIGLPRMRFEAEGGILKLVITNFGTEVSDLIYFPTIAKQNPM